MKIRLRSAAKVNLTLDILARRADGYHELASVVHTIGIWDEIEIEKTAGHGISFSCNREELGRDNLCVRASKAWLEAAGHDFGLQIHLEKQIPTGAGLGGGSGNAAAILLALNRMTDAPLATSKLHEVGAKLGADVPLFLEGGAVLIEGIGEKLTFLESLSGWIVVIKPEISLSTPAVYQAWDGSGLKSNNHTPTLLSRWPAAKLSEIGVHLGNDFERVVPLLTDAPARCHALLQCHGALGAQMTGSGSACFGLFESEDEAKKAANVLEAELAKDVQLSASRLFVAPFCGRGVEFD